MGYILCFIKKILAPQLKSLELKIYEKWQKSCVTRTHMQPSSTILVDVSENRFRWVNEGDLTPNGYGGNFFPPSIPWSKMVFREILDLLQNANFHIKFAITPQGTNVFLIYLSTSYENLIGYQCAKFGNKSFCFQQNTKVLVFQCICQNAITILIFEWP